jgi:hypothetical protein
MTQTPRTRSDGFLERGADVTRLEAFVDAAFAFALTMLVISLDSMPKGMPELLLALKGAPAFAASFAQVAWFWYAHVTWSRRYGLDDGQSTLLSLLMVFLVMVYVYPLKALFATFFGWITQGWLPLGFELRTIGDLTGMFVTYGVVFATMSAIVGLLYLRAWRCRAALALSVDEQVATLATAASWLVGVGVALASIIAAQFLGPHTPRWAYGAPGMLYALMFLSRPVTVAVARRAHARLGAVSAPTAAEAAQRNPNG